MTPKQRSSLRRSRPDPPATTAFTTTTLEDDDEQLHNNNKHTVKQLLQENTLVVKEKNENTNDTYNEAAWRLYGQKRRQWLIENDQATYMTSSFKMNPACSIQKYFALAERVIAQFQQLYDEQRMEDAYVMGHRLLTFLGTALPRHPSFATSTIQRLKTQEHYQYIQQTVEHISILIDEEQLNRYITNDFDPILDDDDDEEDKNDGDFLSKQNQSTFFFDEAVPTTSWETFHIGWTVGNTDASTTSIPAFIDTDESSQDIDSSDLDIFSEFDLSLKHHKEQSEKHHLSMNCSLPEESKEPSCDPDLTDIPDSEDDFDEDDDDDDSDDEMNFHAGPFAMQKRMIQTSRPPVLPQSILRKIAREAVRYESDSEAADSWAQDCGTNCGASDSVTSSSDVGVGTLCDAIPQSPINNNGSPRNLTPGRQQQSHHNSPNESCDPARLAFRSIMSRHTRHLQSLQVEMESLLSTDPLPSRRHVNQGSLSSSSSQLLHSKADASSPFECCTEEKKDDEMLEKKEIIMPCALWHQNLESTKSFPLTLSLLPPPAISAPVKIRADIVTNPP